MTELKTLPPLTAASPGIEEKGGVLLSAIGVDGEDVIALGQDGKHLPRERVVAAMNAYTFGDGFAEVADLDEVWAITIPCDGVLCEGDCNWHLQMTSAFNSIGPDTPGAFPVTVLEA